MQGVPSAEIHGLGAWRLLRPQVVVVLGTQRMSTSATAAVTSARASVTALARSARVWTRLASGGGTARCAL